MNRRWYHQENEYLYTGEQTRDGNGRRERREKTRGRMKNERVEIGVTQGLVSIANLNDNPAKDGDLVPWCGLRSISMIMPAGKTASPLPNESENVPSTVSKKSIPAPQRSQRAICRDSTGNFKYDQLFREISPLPTRDKVAETGYERWEILNEDWICRSSRCLFSFYGENYKELS